jgi:hypothetical protein
LLASIILAVIRNQIKNLENNPLSNDANDFVELRLDSFKIEQKIEFLELQKRELQAKLKKLSIDESIREYKSHFGEVRKRAKRLNDLVDLTIEILQDFCSEPMISSRKNFHPEGGPFVDSLVAFPDNLLERLTLLSHLKIDESGTRINIDW